MALLTPAWLWLLLPWAALVVLTLRAYREKRSVPFLPLWPREEAKDERRRAWRLPPWPVALLLLAILGAILAMCGPNIAAGQRRISRVTIVLDRGVTMLAGGRLEEASQELRRTLLPLLTADAQLRVVDPLRQDELTGPAGLEKVLSIRRATAMELGDQVAAASARSKSESEPTIVLQSWSVLGNVGIIRASANAGECWVQIRNDSPGARAAVLLKGAGETRREDIQLPARGQSQWYSLRCPAALPLRVELENDDALQDDNVRWLLPDDVPARLEVSGGAPDWMRHFVDSYTRTNRPNELSRDVLVTTDAVLADRTVSLATGQDRVTLPHGQPAPDHPLLAHVILPDRVLGGGSLPAGDWRVLLASGDRPLLAVADGSRSVWIGFRPEGEITPDYLILLSNAVRFCCGVECSSGPAEPLGTGWKCIVGPVPEGAIPGTRAGLYRRADEYHAVNVPAPDLSDSPTAQPIETQIAAIARDQSRTPLAPYLWATAAAMVALAAALVHPRP